MALEGTRERASVSLLDYSYKFSPSTDAVLFEAENQLIRIDEKFLSDDILQTIRVPLMAIEAISATSHLKRSNIPIISLIRTFNQFEDKVSFKFEQHLCEAMGQPATREMIELTKEAFCYMRALSWTSNTLKRNSDISIETVRYIHELCCSGSVRGGRCRGFRSGETESAFGGSADSISQILPPSPHRLANLMHSFCAFASSNTYSALGQASVAHFNFERIQPFDEYVDQTGLALAYAIFFRRGLLKSRLIVPFSWSGTANHSYREKALHPYYSPEFFEEKDLASGRNKWAVFNAKNTIIAVEVVSMFLDSVLVLNKKWRQQPIKISKGSTLDSLLRLLLGTPILTVSQAAKSLGKSFSAANDALSRLEKWGIVTSKAINNKERLFIAQESVDLTTKLTHRLMSAKSSRDDEALSIAV